MPKWPCNAFLLRLFLVSYQVDEMAEGRKFLDRRDPCSGQLGKLDSGNGEGQVEVRLADVDHDCRRADHEVVEVVQQLNKNRSGGNSSYQQLKMSYHLKLPIWRPSLLNMQSKSNSQFLTHFKGLLASPQVGLHFLMANQLFVVLYIWLRDLFKWPIRKDDGR